MCVRQKMGVLGPVGTHSEAAALYLAAWQQLDREIVCYGDIGECLHAVETGAVESAFVPVENSLEGAIAVTLDALARSDVLRVRREVIWPVHNYLMGRRTQGEVRVVYSHAQPIAQCRDFLLRHCPQAEIIKTASTARAAEIQRISRGCGSGGNLYAACGPAEWSGRNRGQDRGSRLELHALLRGCM